MIPVVLSTLVLFEYDQRVRELIIHARMCVFDDRWAAQVDQDEDERLEP